MRFNVLRWLATAGAGCVLAVASMHSAGAQVVPGKRAEAPPAAPAAARDAIKGVRDAPPGARREAREAVNETRDEVRRAPRDARDTPGEARREARDNTRELRQDARAARQNLRATRAADLGVWFNTRAAQGVANGLAIADLAVDGAFAAAGFREGDRIVSINGQPVTSEAQFVEYLSSSAAEPFSVVVFRQGQQQTLTLQPAALAQGLVSSDPFYNYGVLIDDSNANQVVVSRVFPRTPAYYAGLRAGDVIVGAGGQRLAGLDALSSALMNANDRLDVQITRNGQAREIDLNTTVEGGVRTALRPDFDGTGFDGTGQLRGDARIGTENSGAIGGNVTTGATTGTATVPGAAAQGARDANPATAVPGTRAVPTSPASPALTPTSPTNPALTPTRPVPPGTPTSPSLQRQPLPGAPAAAPGAPTAAPRAGTGTGGAGASAGGAGAVGGTGALGGAGASAGGAGATGGTGAAGTGTTGGSGAGAGGSGGAAGGSAGGSGGGGGAGGSGGGGAGGT